MHMETTSMTEAEIAQYILDTFPGVETATNFGYTFFFYGSDRKLPFATLASSDNEHDRVSNLDRPDVFRLNIGVSKQTFQSLFGADGVNLRNNDYTAFDRIMPHPHYAAQAFICVLNPTEATSERVRTLLGEAYELARVRSAKRTKTE
jgi:predicted DNA-binding protein (MmcQ/YjbR family)